MTHTLHVTTQDRQVGQLDFDAQDNRYSFAYARAWRDNSRSFYLAPALPLSADAFNSGTVQRFLENLLPEGRALDIASMMSQISKNNIFGLVQLLGKEPVGAFSFLALNVAEAEAATITSEAQHEPIRRVISEEELNQRIRERDAYPFPVWDGKVRLSLAGYQDKLQVLIEGDEMSLADGALSSTHLLKPDSQNPLTPHMVANEHFCMSVAAQLNRALRLGLAVANVQLRRIPEPILLIERFDRLAQWHPEVSHRVQSVRRLHVIDSCQALDLPSTFKYERNFGSGSEVRHIREGVSFERIFSLLDKMVTPATARAYFVRWAILQLLIGNSDAHGKNLSFHVHPAGLSPAPMYDLVAVNAYGDQVENTMVMAYGDVFEPEEITPYALADFAYRTGTPLRQLAREITRMAGAIRQIAPMQAALDIYVGAEVDLVHHIADYMCAQATRLLDIVDQIPRVDANHFA